MILAELVRVNSAPPFLRLLAVLCCAALLCAQAFGVVRGYWCDCTGRGEWTAQDHCHGPHHGDCHRPERPGKEHREGAGAGERQEHQQVRDDFEGRCVPAVAAPSAAPVLLAVLCEVLTWSERIAPAVHCADVDVGARPPPGVAVARTTVLLI